MIHRVLDLGEVSVREIMVARNDMVSIASDASLDDVLGTMIRERHSRLPVYEGKPEKIVDKVVEGRMSKYYEEVCLLDQPFIKDNAISIAQHVAAKAKELGDTLTVAAFIRFKVGESAAAEEAAAE